MASLVESYSYKSILFWLVPAFPLLVGAIIFNMLTIPVVTTVLVLFAASLHGVKPFGDTHAHRILFFVTVIIWMGSFIISQGLSILSGMFSIMGILGLLIGVGRALREGIWAPVNRSGTN